MGIQSSWYVQSSSLRWLSLTWINDIDWLVLVLMDCVYRNFYQGDHTTDLSDVDILYLRVVALYSNSAYTTPRHTSNMLSDGYFNPSDKKLSWCLLTLLATSASLTLYGAVGLVVKEHGMPCE